VDDVKKLIPFKEVNKVDVSNFPKITVILRGYNYEQVRTVVKLLSESNFKSVEIPLNSPEVFQTIDKISKEFGDALLVGAGTVLTMEDAVNSVEAGAKFLLAPTMMSKEVIQYCADRQVITVPGAFTPTEIYQSFQNGADIVKVFPAARLGSKYIADISAPLGKMPLMAVGGINGDNADEFFKAGIQFLGIASGIFNKEDIINQNEAGLKESLVLFQEKLTTGGRTGINE
jgi:2-dehydro-3-deoxyphosphogluconate aldolase / (4S)-4-hydroxy-2-oxoglutarate aldolase